MAAIVWGNVFAILAKKWRFPVVRVAAVSMTARMLGQSNPPRMDPSCMMMWGKAVWILVGRIWQAGALVAAKTCAWDDAAAGTVSMKTSSDTWDED